MDLKIFFFVILDTSSQSSAKCLYVCMLVSPNSLPVGDGELPVDADSPSQPSRSIQEPSHRQRSGLGHEVHELHSRHGAQGEVRQRAKGYCVYEYVFIFKINILHWRKRINLMKHFGHQRVLIKMK